MRPALPEQRLHASWYRQGEILAGIGGSCQKVTPGAPALRHFSTPKLSPRSSGGSLSWLQGGGDFVEVGNRSFDSSVKHLDGEVLIGSV